MRNLEYAVLRLMPNQRRQEVINVGLVLFHEQGFKFRLLKNYGKVRALCPSYQLDLFPTFEQDIQFLIGADATYENVESTLRSLGGFLLGPKSAISYQTGSELSAKIEELMCTYIYPETNLADAQPSTLFHALRKELSLIANVSNIHEDLESFQIVEWYAIDEQGWLKSEFAYKTDSRTVFIQTLDLRVSDRRELFRTISSRKIIGESIREAFADRAEILVAYRVSESARAVGGAHLLSLVKGYADELCDFEDLRQARSLADKIAWSYGPNKPLEMFH